MNVCPYCDSEKIQPSRLLSFKEHFLKSFNYVPFRCRDCGWRGTLKVKLKFKLNSKQKARRLKEIVITLLAATAASYFIVRLIVQ